MTREEQKYRVTTRHQLIDLNKENTNFKLQFECYSDPNDQFQVCVTDQGELDTKDLSTLPFKDSVNGSVSGNIVADTNTYQNYFIVLRSDKECDVMVVIDLEPMALVPEEDLAPDHDNEQVKGHHTHGHVHDDYPMWKRGLFYMTIATLLCIVAFYILGMGEYKQYTEVVSSALPSLIDDITSQL
jgi:hypothetical protein